MKTSFEVVKKPYQSYKVVFSAEENKILAKPTVKSATTAAVSMWHSVKRTNSEFGVKLKKVHDQMAFQSSKSLFSKWCMSVGIPRSTAYWHLQDKSVRAAKREAAKVARHPLTPDAAYEGLKVTFGKYADPKRVFTLLSKVWSYCCAEAGPLTQPKIGA
jgi:hypothetical protein